MIKSNGGYHKDKKKIRFNNDNKTIFASEGEEYGQIVKKEGQHRVIVELVDKNKVKTRVVGLIVGKLRKFACNKDDYVLCVPNYSGTGGKEYGIIHKYKQCDLEKLWTDKKFFFEKDLDSKDDSVYEKEVEVFHKMSREEIANEMMKDLSDDDSDDESDDDSDDSNSENDKSYVPSLDEL